MTTSSSRRRSTKLEPAPMAPNTSDGVDERMSDDGGHVELTSASEPTTNETLIRRESLLEGLQLTGRAAAPKANLPILAGVRIEADPDHQSLRLACTNLEIGILHRIDARVMQRWALVIPVKMLTEAIAAIPHETVRLYYDSETTSITIEGVGGDNGNGVASQCVMYGMDADEFPTIKDGSDMQTMLTIDGETVRRMVRKLGFIPSPVEHMPTHAAVHLVMRDTTLVCHATDGFRLSKLSIPIAEGNGKPFDVMIPKPTVRELGRIVEDSNRVVMRTDDTGNMIWFTWKNTTLVSRIVDGTYPNVEKVFPTAYKTEARPRLLWLTSLIRQARIFAENNVVEITFNPDHLAMRAVTKQTGATSVSMPCASVGETTVVYLNIEYLREACEALDLDEISVEIAGTMSPVVIREHGSDRFVHVIMPMSPPKNS